MRIRRSVIALAMLTLFLMPRVGKSQGTQPGDKRKSSVAKMGQNYPNPFNPDASIDFDIGGYPTCTEPGKQYRVSLQVFNVLAQVVAVPDLVKASSGVAKGQLKNLQLPCGHYTAFWNGKYAGSSRSVSSGLYIWALDVNGGREQVVKSIVAK